MNKEKVRKAKGRTEGRGSEWKFRTRKRGKKMDKGKAGVGVEKWEDMGKEEEEEEEVAASRGSKRTKGKPRGRRGKGSFFENKRTGQIVMKALCSCTIKRKIQQHEGMPNYNSTRLRTTFLSIYLFVCRSVKSPTSLSNYVYVYKFMFIYLFVCLSVKLTICLSGYVYVYKFMPIYLFVCLPNSFLYICLSISLPT